MSTEYIELRQLTVAHQAKAGCRTCDERFEKIEAAAELVVGRRLLSLLGRRARRRRMKQV